METKNNKPRIIISGGGTGGHIFPAVSIANAIKELRPDAEILFVGAEGRMEMQRVPDAGYKIIGLPVAGFDRKHLWKNFAVLVKLARSQWKARSIMMAFPLHDSQKVADKVSQDNSTDNRPKILIVDDDTVSVIRRQGLSALWWPPMTI